MMRPCALKISPWLLYDMQGRSFLRVVELKRVLLAVRISMSCISLRIHSRHHTCSSTFCCLLLLLLPCQEGTGDGKNELVLLDEDDNLENEEESQGMDAPLTCRNLGQHLQMSCC